ncbi:asparagine synthase C-terminal domain-containing protein [Methylicorpusculum oleiharenae]|uniref:asparagine synthetase B family protein n=1 Tax=Methylicorpusculum oleiharenae TaxID=1338687 RepID=UPI0013590DEA|nr:asparagine synthase C-terminal domain-containing protein [Methylicorpusculum oleiharenae]MCD2451800.1 asparagine synthase C-terminal domain-containing protein [Methylicorpusculum oleiharenae]
MGFIAGSFTDTPNQNQPEQWLQRIKQQAPQFFRDDLNVSKAGELSYLAFDKSLIAGSHYVIADEGGHHLAKDQLQKLAERFIEKGSSSLNQAEYPFNGLMFNQAKKELLLMTDFLGLTHLYYAQIPGGLVFGSTADAVIAHPMVSDEVSQQTIYDYLYFHHCPSPNTIYKQVKKLEGGQLLVFKEGKVTLSYYWVPEFSENRRVSNEEAGKILKEKLIDAVRQAAVGSDQTGAFLSGGLDSSSVAGALSEVYPGQARTYTMGFPVEGYDEIEYARIAVDRFKTRSNEYYLTPEDTVAAIPKIAAYYDEPFGNSSALAAYYCAKMAKDSGINVMLAGDGGDELFAGNERYAKQLLFDKYYQIPGLARILLKSGLTHAPQILLKNKIIFKAKRYVEQAEIPLPDRLQDYNFMNRHSAHDIFNADFLDAIDVNSPIKSLRDCYNRPAKAGALNRMLYMDWKTTLHDNDLVKVNKMCEMAGVEVRYPLLDKSIIDLSCQIPSSDKLKGQQLRWFYKEAMRNYLPDQIINKSKHGFGLPFGIWLKDHQPLKELAYDSINALKKRDYLRSDFLDHAIKMHQSVHAAYYGELIWILMMLEQWFQAKKR